MEIIPDLISKKHPGSDIEVDIASKRIKYEDLIPIYDDENLDPSLVIKPLENNKVLLFNSKALAPVVNDTWKVIEDTLESLSSQAGDLELILKIFLYNLRILCYPFWVEGNLIESSDVYKEILTILDDWPRSDVLKKDAIKSLNLLSIVLAKISSILNLKSDSNVNYEHYPLNELKNSLASISDGAFKESNILNAEMKRVKSEGSLKEKGNEYLAAKNELIWLRRKAARLDLFSFELKSRLNDHNKCLKELSGEISEIKNNSNNISDSNINNNNSNINNNNKNNKNDNNNTDVEIGNSIVKLEAQQWRNLSEDLENEIERLRKEKIELMERFQQLESFEYNINDRKILKQQNIESQRLIGEKIKIQKIAIEGLKRSYKNLETAYKKTIKEIKGLVDQGSEKIKKVQNDYELTISKAYNTKPYFSKNEVLSSNIDYEINNRISFSLGGLLDLRMNNVNLKYINRIIELDSQLKLVKDDEKTRVSKYPILDTTEIGQNPSLAEKIIFSEKKLQTLTKAFENQTNSGLSLDKLINDTYSLESSAQNKDLFHYHETVLQNSLQLDEKQDEIISLKKAEYQVRRQGKIILHYSVQSEKKKDCLINCYETEFITSRLLNDRMSYKLEQISNLENHYNQIEKDIVDAKTIESILIEKCLQMEDELKSLQEDLKIVYRNLDEAQDKLRDSKVKLFNFSNLQNQKLIDGNNIKDDGLLENYRRCYNCCLCSRANQVDIIIVVCKHVFCSSCVEEKCLKLRNRKCPICGTKFDKSDVLQLHFA